MEQTRMGVEQTAMAASRCDLSALAADAQACVEHPGFDAAMRAFCRDLSRFYSMEFFRRGGVVDTITWATAVMLLYLDAYAPEHANANRLVAICTGGGLSGATAVRNAIALLRQSGMILVDGRAENGRAQRLRPSPHMVAQMQSELALRLAAIEPVIRWPKPAAEWARTEGVLLAFARGNIEAYRDENFTLYSTFPEIRAFMDRHCGYLILMDALTRLDVSAEGASTVLPLSELSRKYAVSRAHVRKLFAAAAAQGWLAFEAGGRLAIPAANFARFRLWFGYEFVWTRRLVVELIKPVE